MTTATLISLVEDSVLHPKLAASLRVHLDWIQYRQNFREPVAIRRTVDHQGRPLTLAEIAIDTRQVSSDALRDQLAAAVASLGPDAAGGGEVVLDEFRPYRDCIIWRFNLVFWRHLKDWEDATGRGFEASLPSGSSDANHPQAVADSATDFWQRMARLHQTGQLPQTLYGLEIGVGTGERAAAWLDAFKAHDEAQGTNFYARLHFMLGDYSETSLERAMQRVSHHGDHASGRQLDALNPFKSLKEYRFKVMYVHLTNTYDNLPFDDLVRRDGRLYIIEVRPYFTREHAAALMADFGLSREGLLEAIERLLVDGPRAAVPERAVEFWRRVWGGLLLEERLRELHEGEQDHIPPGLNRSHLDDLLKEAPDDVRFHVSRGACESFANTLPLLHPYGYLQVQDIFVTEMEDYRKGFRGPGKLDGSLVTWVNGALLREIGAKGGYNVYFEPFTYRPGTKTSILYTTRRD